MTIDIHLFNSNCHLWTSTEQSSTLFQPIFTKTISLYFITEFLEALFFPAQVKKKY